MSTSTIGISVFAIYLPHLSGDSSTIKSILSSVRLVTLQNILALPEAP